MRNGWQRLYEYEYSVHRGVSSTPYHGIRGTRFPPHVGAETTGSNRNHLLLLLSCLPLSDEPNRTERSRILSPTHHARGIDGFEHAGSLLFLDSGSIATRWDGWKMETGGVNRWNGRRADPFPMTSPWSGIVFLLPLPMRSPLGRTRRVGNMAETWKHWLR